MTTDRGRPGSRRHLTRLMMAAAVIAIGIAGLMVAPPIVKAFVPRRAFREAIPVFLKVALGAYLAGLATAMPASIALVVAILRSRRRGARAPRKARALMACLSFLLGSLMLEGMAAAWQARAHGSPPIEARFSATDGPARPATDELTIVVIGESSAIGMPYDPWLSIGQIVGWQLERTFPGRRVVVDIQGMGGFSLQEAIGRLRYLKRRPDAVLLYSGHNEFQAFYRLSREVDYYADRVSGRTRATWALRSASRLGDLILETLDRQAVDAPPKTSAARPLVDSPACTKDERARIVAAFRSRLGLVYDYCERVGALPIVFVPAGNDGGFDPSRSLMDPSATPEERAAFAVAFREAAAREGPDPKASEAAFRALIARQPGFAEAHFRLARLLERTGAREEANRHYVEARDRDGMPLRCTSDIEAIIREVAAPRDGILIDAAEVLRPLSPRGILDGRIFHDAHHPNLAGYTALAREVLDRLRERRSFGWPAGQPAPVLEPEDVAAHFGVDASRWAEVCRRSEIWYKAVAPIRFDPTDRLMKARRYGLAAGKILGGTPPEQAGVPGIGVPPKGDAVRTSYR